MQPTYNQGGAGGMAINWPDDPVIGGAPGAAAADDDDDLYA